jgi:hypothetical protein
MDSADNVDSAFRIFQSFELPSADTHAAKEATKRGQQCCPCRGAIYYSFVSMDSADNVDSAFRIFQSFEIPSADTHAAKEAHQARTAVLSMKTNVHLEKEFSWTARTARTMLSRSSNVLKFLLLTLMPPTKPTKRRQQCCP